VGEKSKKSCCTPGRNQAALPGREGGQTVSGNFFVRVNSGSPDGMKRLAGGAFLMGADDDVGYPADGEGPVRKVSVDPFYIDVTPVTNRQFNDFINATGYRTEADEFGWSFVFHLHVPPKASVQAVRGLEWWRAVTRANWRRPEGLGSNIKKRKDYPVVHVSWRDAVAYGEWAGKRLPTEAEWEYAARGGLVQKRYAWGDELMSDDEHQCNIWQGTFPTHDTGEDGFTGTSPARHYKANGFGLYSVAGNVWEWCHDWFHPTYHQTDGRDNPIGPPEGSRKAIRGGSFLCHDSYCNRYRVAARTSNTPDSSAANLGFRCVRDV
jgi:formylglycine-generating enzyme required for sulfatase activity